MEFADLYKQRGSQSLTGNERRDATILIVESDHGMRTNIRQALVSVDFANIADAPDHVAALQKIADRHFTHVIFEAKRTNMPVREFVQKALELDSNLVLLASSFEPTIDDVFNLLIAGARGYLVKPFTSGNLDDALLLATKGERIPDAILFAKNRNEALAALMMTAVDKLALVVRQSRHFETALREIPKRQLALKRAGEIGLLFAEGGQEALAQAIMSFCEERAHGPATTLGRVRKRLNKRAPRREGDGHDPQSVSEILSVQAPSLDSISAATSSTDAVEADPIAATPAELHQR